MNKRIFTFFLSIVLVFAFNMSVFADDETDNDYQNDQLSDLTTIDTTSPAQVVVDITQLLTPTVSDPDVNEEITPDLVTVVDPVLVDVSVSKQAVSASNTNGFKAVILQLLGDYETTVTDYTYQSGSSGYYSHSINIERDWSWICSCGIFAILLYCTFRTIGGICARF